MHKIITSGTKPSRALLLAAPGSGLVRPRERAGASVMGVDVDEPDSLPAEAAEKAASLGAPSNADGAASFLRREESSWRVS
jgi:hypothetical protein